MFVLAAPTITLAVQNTGHYAIISFFFSVPLAMFTCDIYDSL